MENFQNIVENNIDNSRKFESLEEELLDYQFQYIEKLHDGVLKPLEDEDKDQDRSFEYYLGNFTSFREYLKNEYQAREKGDIYGKKEEREKFENWFNGIKKEIYKDYKLDKSNYRTKISKIFKDNFKKLGPRGVKDKKNIEDLEKDKEVGLIHFNLHKIGNELTQFGINEGDDCFSIHFKNLIDQKKENNSVNNIFSGESLSKLAEYIIDKEPQVKAVIGRSWLVDSPIGKRIGFNIYKKHKRIGNHSGFWGQFINEKGEINKERMQRFLNTGIPDFYVSEGFIKTEDFLKKFLNRKGLIKLKERTEESRKITEETRVLSKELNEKWNLLSWNEVVLLLNNHKIYVNYLKTQDGQEFLDMLKAMKEYGSINDINFIYDNKEEIFNKMHKYLNEKSNIYQEKELMIK